MRQGPVGWREDGRGGDGRITIEGRPVRGCLPKGRRTGAQRPNVLLMAVILSQSVWGSYGCSTGGERRKVPP